MRELWQLNRPIDKASVFELIDMEAMFVMGAEKALMLLTDYGLHYPNAATLFEFATELRAMQIDLDRRRHAQAQPHLQQL